MKKCFYKTFQKYSQKILSGHNFEMAVICFDDESEMGFHWSARPSHHFFVQRGPSWLNDCLQGVQIGVVTSWNISLQNRSDSKVHGINTRRCSCPNFLIPKPSWFGPAPPHLQTKAQGSLCELKQYPVWRFIWSQKFLWAKEGIFFLQHVQINLAIHFKLLPMNNKRNLLTSDTTVAKTIPQTGFLSLNWLQTLTGESQELGT